MNEQAVKEAAIWAAREPQKGPHEAWNRDVAIARAGIVAAIEQFHKEGKLSQALLYVLQDEGAKLYGQIYNSHLEKGPSDLFGGRA